MKSKHLLVALSILIILSLMLAGCGSQPSPNTQAQSSPTPDLIGKADVKDPEPEKTVKSKTWGEVVANQVGVILKDGTNIADAEKVASDLGGQIIGQVEFFGLYQIETSDASEEALLATMAKAATLPNVEIVIPNTRAYLLDSGCKACGPLNDPFYGGTDGKAYEMIGVKSAWNIIKASGVKLNDVTVGVMDDGLYSKSDDIGGKTKIEGIDANDSTEEPEKDDHGNIVNGGYNHGTMVTHVIAADPANSGPAGIAGILGDKLTVKVKNKNKGSTKEAKPNPNDPTQIVWTDGKSYVYSNFVSALEQIKAGSTVINCSFGPDHPEAANAQLAAAWKKFLTHVQEKYPKVVFVAAAGNEKGGLDGNNYWPGGIKAPNLVTVGALNNDGSKANFTNFATGDGEVSVSAPGVQVPMAVGPDGKTIRSSGTSFSSPMVAGTIALIKSINPGLTAEQIKKILADTAAPGVPGEKQSLLIPEGMGAGVLRVDAAVLQAINDMRIAKGEKPLDQKTLEQMATLDGSATMKDPLNYTVKASIAAVGDSGTDIGIELQGEGSIGGSTKKNLKAAGDVTWDITLLKKENPPSVRLCRSDTNACCDMPLEVIDLAGDWTGTLVAKEAFVASDITIPDPIDDTKPPTVIKKEECEQQLKDNMNKDNAVNWTFKPTSPDAGTVETKSSGSSSESKAQSMPYKFNGNSVTFGYKQQGYAATFEGQLSVSDSTYTISGPFTIVMEDKGAVALRISGTFTVSKPKPKL